jgi:excisionase family DNA binding protein
MERRFLTVRDAATFLNVSQSAIRLWISQDRLRCVRAGGRVLIDREYLEQRAAGGQLLEPAGEAPEAESGRTRQC